MAALLKGIRWFRVAAHAALPLWIPLLVLAAILSTTSTKVSAAALGESRPDKTKSLYIGVVTDLNLCIPVDSKSTDMLLSNINKNPLSPFIISFQFPRTTECNSYFQNLQNTQTNKQTNQQLSILPPCSVLGNNKIAGESGAKVNAVGSKVIPRFLSKGAIYRAVTGDSLSLPCHVENAGKQIAAPIIIIGRSCCVIAADHCF